MSSTTVLSKLEYLKNNSKIIAIDAFIVFVMMNLAACGLIYEYLFSHYAGRVIGSHETAIYSIIGIMIVSMGVGALCAKRFKDAFLSLSVLESLIAILAFGGLFVISGSQALANDLPIIIANAYNIPVDFTTKGGMMNTVIDLLTSSSYIMAAIVGVLIGMEIPFVARIRESVHEKHLQHNTGMIYGVDYIGAGIGAYIWVNLLLQMEVAQSVTLVATVNVLVGFCFILVFRKKIKRMKLVVALQFFTVLIIYLGSTNLQSWQESLEDTLFADKKVFSMNTQFQRIAITEGLNPYDKSPVYTFFINGRTQFSQGDEHIYHSLLVNPAMELTQNLDDVLVIGGGDGLAVRDILKYNPKSVTLLDLDEKIIDFFKEPLYVDGKQVNDALLKLNENSFSDERVNFMFGDAFINARQLFMMGRKFSTIIIDLPDPSHPDLNKMYSKTFYRNMNALLKDGGAIVIQSTSPYNAKRAFQSIKRTMEAAKFENVDQYHHHVPSFGEWGWTIALKSGESPKSKIAKLEKFSVENDWLTVGILKGTFEFGKNYYNNYNEIGVNLIGSAVTYKYHQDAWENNNAFVQTN
jgi:spermidine synthase